MRNLKSNEKKVVWDVGSRPRKDNKFPVPFSAFNSDGLLVTIIERAYVRHKNGGQSTLRIACIAQNWLNWKKYPTNVRDWNKF